MAYESTFNDPVDAGPGTQTWNIDPWLYTARVRVWGGGGGGEFINVNTDLSSIAGDHGSSSSVFGVVANGGLAGGRRANGTTAKNVGGNGGTVTLTNVPNWSNLGVSITTANGQNGTFSSGGSAGSGGAGTGGDATPGFATYRSTSTHFFNNDTNEHLFQSVSSDITLTYENPNAADGIFETTPSYGKYYQLTFVVPYANNNWTWSVTDICQNAAGGGDAAPYSLNGSANKDTTGIDLWFQNNAGGNGYIRCFSFISTGLKVGAQGLGGGGGGFAEFNLTRQNLIDAGYNMNPYESDNITQRTGDLLTFIVGPGGSSSFDSGDSGRVTIHWYEIPQVYLSTNRQAIVAGGNATLSWYTLGDGNSLIFTEGNINNKNLTSSETVSPTVTTTYTAQASGFGGVSFNNEATVTIIVYQIPEIITFEVPDEIDYGTETISVEYAAKYCDISLEVTVRYSYDYGPNASLGILEGETISIAVDNVSPEYNDPNSIVQGTLDINLPWTEFGPSYYYITIEALGSGGSDNDQKTTTVIIDTVPDNLNIPDTLEVLKDEAPVITPGVELIQEGLLVNDIDIPVEVKSNYPIQVAINDLNNWTNVREL